MESPPLIAAPTRLILCLDGSDYKPDQTSTPTNIYRIYASVTNGKCADKETGITYNQIPLYFPGIGGADDVLSKDRLQAGVLGNGYQDRIRDIYEKCCQLKGSQDEVVFFGFSRGAYVARAVAGLLHRFGALVSAGSPDFAKAYKKVLREADTSHSLARSLSLSPRESISSLSTSASAELRPPPRIRFLGVFDTIKAANDGSFDISFNHSINHFRQALALHEDRKALAPAALYPEEFYRTELRKEQRSFIQAFFIGSHGDMGGVLNKVGLGLYPLQWMVLEANSCGVWFDFEKRTSHTRYGMIEAPLSVVFPKLDNGKDSLKSSFTTANEIEVTMQDLRPIHDQVKFRDVYAIKLNMRPGTIRAKKQRDIFDGNGYLRGYCDQVPQGTIIHPSCYCLLDEHINVALDTKEAKLQRHIEEWREKMLGMENGHVNFGFWSSEPLDDDDLDLGAIRVLVCGNTGVGKSTLINKTFGVEVTTSSDRTRGIHDVREEIKFEGRPDLIVHDSGGFEAGADTEFLAIEEFLKDKSSEEEVANRLHVIWFCVEITSARTLQTATEKLFQAVGKYANDVPIVVVATKKDDFLDIEFSAKRKDMKKNKETFDEEICDNCAEEKLRERLDEVKQEMESVHGGRLDAIVAVSQDDKESIALLSKTTSQCFDLDKVRLLYVRAQVARLDLKIDAALCEVMRRYKMLIKTATGLSVTPLVPTAYRKAAATKACQAIMNCFGLPTVSAEAAILALKTNVWTQSGVDVHMVLGEVINLVGAIGTGFAGGIPAFLVTGTLSMPLVVPATCRLFLTMTTDLILVLIRSFQEATFRKTAMPQERDVQTGARIYRIRGFSQHIHREIKRLVPRRNVTACYRIEKIRQTTEANVERVKDQLLDSESLLVDMEKLKVRSQSDADTEQDEDEDDESPGSDTVFYQEVREANRRDAAELAATSEVFEMPESRRAITTELPGHDAAAELPGDSIRAELPADTKFTSEMQHGRAPVYRPQDLPG